jgi:hypothetical protein
MFKNWLKPKNNTTVGPVMPASRYAHWPITPGLPAIHFDTYARHYLPISDGAMALLAQASNEVLRHCRIGSVRVKP